MTVVFEKLKMDSESAAKVAGGFVRVPGLLRRWEIPQVVRPGAEYRIEPAGELKDGTDVFVVFQRASTDRVSRGVPVELSFAEGQPALKARMLPLRIDGDCVVALLALHAGPRSVLARLGELLKATRGTPSATEVSR